MAVRRWAVRILWSLAALALGTLVSLAYLVLYFRLSGESGADAFSFWYFSSLFGLLGWLLFAIPMIVFLHKRYDDFPVSLALLIGGGLGWLTFVCYQVIWIGFQWPLVYHVYALLAGTVAGPLYVLGIRRIETRLDRRASQGHEISNSNN